jgi:anti-sigma regulatory factor (Ser/Thr protein kinase)
VTAVESSGLVHDAFVYSSEDEFLAGSLPFLEEGVERGEPILAAPTHANARLLQERLGRRVGSVDWAENSESHRTVERLGLFLEFIQGHIDRGAARVRLLGEPCWPERGGPGVAEWKRYESFLNVALAPHRVWLVCPYDSSRLAPDIVEDARRTHPSMGFGESRADSPDYLDPIDFARRIDDVRLPRPPAEAAEGYFRTAADVRRFVREHGLPAGVEAERLEDAELAASEVAANVFRHAADVARIRAWTEDDRFVCEIDDTGRGIHDPFAGYELPEPTAPAGRGLPIARRLADVVEVRTIGTGTVVRLHFTRGRP